MRLLAPLVLLAACYAAAAAEVPQPTILPGGFVDPTGQISIFNTPSGGVQAVEMAAGKSFFRTDQAQRPLFVAGERLYALAAVQAPVVRGLCFEWRPGWEGPHTGFRLVAFDMAQFGAVVLHSDTVALPEWASVVDAYDRSCTLRWHTENGRLVVEWQVKAWYAGPTQKTPPEEATFRRQAAGAVRFDLQTAAFETLPPPPAPPAPPEFEGWRELERRALRWQKRTATQLLVVTLEEAHGRQTLTLRTFDLATRQPLIVQALKSGERLVVLATTDEQYLCVRDSAPSPDHDTGDPSQALRWSIVNAVTGQSVGEVPYEPGMTAATIVGGRIYFLLARRLSGPLDRPFVQPRALRAVDLRTGTTLWEQPIGGTPASPPALIAWPTPPAKPADNKAAAPR